MKHFGYAILILVLLSACNEETRSINLVVKNQSSDTIWINYYKLGNNNYSCCYNMDTLDIYIPPNDSEKMIEFIVKDTKQYYSDDWYHVYRISINTLVNETSDPMSIDPNIAHYWSYLHTENETSYLLEITDSLF